ncbi:MAG: hypothetical protein E7597_06740 [Ruminococcaceae bacterium]|nr:hypothetical protein [Oscillospiraceae bacterium]
MRRFTVLLLSVAVLALSLSATMTASAYTQEDLMEEFKTIPASHWVLADFENLSRTMRLTEEQCNQLWPILQEVKALLPTDNGPTVHAGTNNGNTGRMYSAEVVAQVMDHIRAACRITGCTFVKSLVPNPTHEIDIVFKLYDSTGKLIFEYDGDLIKQTGTDVAGSTSTSSPWYLYGGMGALILSLAGAVFATKRVRRSLAAA